jgi:hypothetical protein
MYRDDTCAVCGESLPPDHLYCREHAAVVDDLLHELGERLPRLVEDLARCAALLGMVHPETWDWLAEAAGRDEEVWPPRTTVVVAADGEDVDVDVDTEPGRVTASLTLDLGTALSALATALGGAGVERLAAAAAGAEGAGATH